MTHFATLLLVVLALLTGTRFADAATYYVSSGQGDGAQVAGLDSNPGTLTYPWRTLQFAFTHMTRGDKLIIRGGSYDTGEKSLTSNGTDSIIPSGASFDAPTKVQAYPGETVVFRRYVETSTCCFATGATELQIRDGIHLATPEECDYFADLTNQTPYPCWSGGPDPNGLPWQSYPYGYLYGYVMFIGGATQYVVFDGINFDARGLAGLISFSCNSGCDASNYDGPSHLRFQNLEIRNAIASCVAQLGVNSSVQADLQFINVKIHHCGVPYDTHYYKNDPALGLARHNDNARFYHPWYMHSGGNSLINSETYESAGTGLSPDGSNNVIAGNYIHDNSSHGIYIAGGNNLTLCNNIFYNNGGIEIYHLNYGDQSRICNNTIVVGPKYFTSATSGYSWGIYLHTTAQGATYENNIVEGFQYGIFNSATYGSTITIRNNLIRTAPAGNEFYLTDGAAAPVRTNNLLNLDPKFVDQANRNYHLQSGSPAIDAGYNNGLTTDFDGNTRPVGSAIDIGAYESGTSAQQAPGAVVIAKAGTNFSVNEGQTGVTLDGSGSSDPDNNPLTYAWTQLPGGTAVTLSGAATATPSFTAPTVGVGGETLTFQLRVTTPANGNSSTDTVSVTVVNVNHPPVALAGPDQSVANGSAVAEGSPVTLHGEHSFDIDNDPFNYAWTQVNNGSPTVTLTGANTANPIFTAPYAGTSGAPGVVATLVFELRVDDGYPQDAPASGYTFANVADQVTVEITNVNNNPTANAGVDQTVDEHSLVTLKGNLSSDPDSDILSYAWTQVGGPTVVLSGATTATPSFAAPFVNVGGVDLQFKLTVNDGYNGTATDNVVIHVQNINDPPLASAAQPTIATLWPPNHGMVSVGITGVRDPNNNATITITGVTQDEPTNGLGDGDTAIDAVINAKGTVLLRAERSGNGNGRVYHVHFTASDFEGSSSGVVKVSVPPSANKPAVDGGELYDSTH